MTASKETTFGWFRNCSPTVL